MVQSIQVTILNSPSLVLRLVYVAMKCCFNLGFVPQLSCIKAWRGLCVDVLSGCLPACRSTASKAKALPAYEDSSYRALASV